MRARQARRAHLGGGDRIAAELLLDAPRQADARRPFRVAIVGLGPKGLFALERLLDHATRLDAAIRMEIDIFEPHAVPGAGPVYDPGQPGYLKMNFAAGELDMWWPSSRAVPARERQAFAAWRTGTDEYPPRAEVGRYLSEGFETLLRHAPPTVRVRIFPARVESALPDAGRWELRTAESAASYDEVLLAVGHQCGSDTALASRWEHAARLVPAVFPVEQRLSPDALPAGATVAIRGFALTFIDAALALTEGRGGRFEATGHPYRLRYLPGEGEAGVLLPFTRSGRPMLAKPGTAIVRRTPALGQIAAQGRARIAALGGAADLHGDLVPILNSTACASLAAATGGPDDRRLHVAVGRWLAEAVGGVTASAAPEPAGTIEQSLSVAAGLTAPGIPWALGHTWRALYPAIVSHLGGDGLAERDWPAFIRLSAELERVAFGPPPLNAAKLLALIEAGRVDLAHVRGGELVSEAGRTVLRSAAGERAIDVVVDAVLPGPGAVSHPGLLAHVVASGQARILAGRRGLDIAPSGSCRTSAGRVTQGLAAVGRPTEDSVIGNDTLNRTLHPQPDRWARRVVARCREEYIGAARRGLREAART